MTSNGAGRAMSDLIDEEETTGNAPEYTVSEISGAVKRTIEGAFSAQLV